MPWQPYGLPTFPCYGFHPSGKPKNFSWQSFSNSQQRHILGYPPVVSTPYMAFHTVTQQPPNSSIGISPPWSWLPLVSNDQTTNIGQAFSSMSLRQQEDSTWYMDTGATVST